MIYTPKEKLTVIELAEEREFVFFDEIIPVLYERPSNMVYIEFQERLYGIISMGDISRENVGNDKKVFINKRYTFIYPEEYMRARKIFYEKKNINALPVVDEKGVLLGDYTRWDDIFYKRNIESFINIKISEELIIKSVALVKPCKIFEKKNIILEECENTLRKIGIHVEIISREQIFDCIDVIDKVLFVDEDELRGTLVLYKDLLFRNCDWSKVVTYRGFSYLLNRKDIKSAWNEIEKLDISILLLDFENKNKYSNELQKRINKKYENADIIVKSCLPEKVKKEFFVDIYDERYKNQIFPIPHSVSLKDGYLELKDDSQMLFHAHGGERLTIDQPNEYENCIYMFGPCNILGVYVEDKHTIASQLQIKINEAGFPYKVVNLGVHTPDPLMDLNKILETPIKKGDILILDKRDMEIDSFLKIDLINILKNNYVSENWFADNFRHHNYKVNSLFADAIYNKLKPILKKDKTFIQNEIVKSNNYGIKNYVSQYFNSFNYKMYKSIGAIIMNCNPFTYGHKYLIEESLKVVDYLIIFVVQEDKSVFSFEERFAMVKEGITDLKNVLVVPSGEYILSQKTFPEYFMKVVDNDLVKNVEEDIRIFAEEIAPLLHITHRLVGEEIQDEVTNEYNKAMKRILPIHGIQLVEIPRKTCNGSIISATSVRKCLEIGDIDKLSDLVPETTKKILFTLNE